MHQMDAANFRQIAGELRMSSADLEALVRRGPHACQSHQGLAPSRQAADGSFPADRPISRIPFQGFVLLRTRLFSGIRFSRIYFPRNLFSPRIRSPRIRIAVETLTALFPMISRVGLVHLSPIG
jgi:hypothetical protein